jgi:dipeptidyl aminopeptidase/acylaminoacyl peptidase
VAVAPGEHRVTLRREGYAEATYTVRLETGQSAMLAGELWLRRPEVRRLRPAFPGAAIAGATFLDDGRIALAVALPPGDERQLWLLDGQGSARRVGPPQAWGSIAISPDGRRVAYLMPMEQSRSYSPALSAAIVARSLWPGRATSFTFSAGMARSCSI